MTVVVWVYVCMGNWLCGSVSGWGSEVVWVCQYVCQVLWGCVVGVWGVVWVGVEDCSDVCGCMS